MWQTAFKFILFDKPKSIGILIGIVISIFLIGQQLSTLRYLTVLMGGLISNSNSTAQNIWIVDSKTTNINILNKIDSRISQEVRSLPDVENAYPIVISNALVSFEDGNSTGITLIGSEAPTFMAGPHPSKIIAGDIGHLTASNAFSAEIFNSKNFGVDLRLDQVFELNNKQALIKVITKRAQGFGGDYMYTSLQNARYYANFPADKVSIIAVQPKDGADKNALIQRINNTFYGIRAWDTEHLKNASIREILISSNMGISFGSLIIFAVISGFFIIGLTLYSAALDRITDYGTLKAIGATNAYVSRLIFYQALLFAFMGYVISLTLLYGFKMGVSKTGLHIVIDWKLAIILASITLFMALGGSIFALLKIRKLEPASIF